MNPFRVAVLGAGDRGKAYSKALKQLENDCVLVNVCDILDDRAQKAKEDFGFEETFYDYWDAVDTNDIDIVIVCTPAYFHSEMAMYALNRKKHVLCEKPMDLSFEKASEMVACAKRNGRVLAIGHQYHNFMNFCKLKKVFEQGAVGRPVLMRCEDTRPVRPKIAMHDAEFGNGGPLNDMSCHFTDLMRWYFDADPVSVCAKGLVLAENSPTLASIPNKAVDTVNILVTFASGDVGVITVSWAYPKNKHWRQQVSAYGPAGTVEVAGDAVTAYLEDDNNVTYELDSRERDETENPEKTVLRHFLDEINGVGKVQVTGEDALKAFAVSLAAVKSSRLGRPVSLQEIYNEKPSIYSAMHEKEEGRTW